MFIKTEKCQILTVGAAFVFEYRGNSIILQSCENQGCIVSVCKGLSNTRYSYNSLYYCTGLRNVVIAYRRSNKLFNS